ncbi:hypothetical protein OAO87_04605, partial [bacterium]|nr:hypothetical protein [bacterium]
MAPLCSTMGVCAVLGRPVEQYEPAYALVVVSAIGLAPLSRWARVAIGTAALTGLGMALNHRAELKSVALNHRAELKSVALNLSTQLKQLKRTTLTLQLNHKQELRKRDSAKQLAVAARAQARRRAAAAAADPLALPPLREVALRWSDFEAHMRATPQRQAALEAHMPRGYPTWNLTARYGEWLRNQRVHVTPHQGRAVVRATRLPIVSYMFTPGRRSYALGACKSITLNARCNRDLLLITNCSAAALPSAIGCYDWGANAERSGAASVLRQGSHDACTLSLALSPLSSLSSLALSSLPPSLRSVRDECTHCMYAHTAR